MKKILMERIIVKYLINQATSVEKKTLLLWLKKAKNIKIFNSYVKINYAIDYEIKKFDSKKANRELLQFIRNDKKIQFKRKVNIVLKFAAVIVIFIGIGYLFNQPDSNNFKTNTIVSKNEFITLESEDGTIVSINPNMSGKIKDIKGRVVGNQKKSQIIYTSSIKQSKTVYNTLNIPYGKRFKVILSDGTQVHLNAGSSLKYPVDFLDGKIRKVFLSGEAYFDVFRDKKHPFIVNVNNINVKALGTEFNISSYPDDKTINTVLVEGSVKIYEKGKEDRFDASIIIKPNSMAVWDRNQKSITVKKVDSKIYTSWLNGKLIFRNTPFKEIRKVLERQYDVKIINNNKLLDKQQFDAAFDIETIDEILKSFSSSFKIEYKIKDNVIIINN